jgi:TPR repeat protein
MHLVLHLNYDGVPTWLHEGLAEFIGATVVEDNDIEVGRPIWPHINLLREKKLLPTAALFAVDHSSPEYNERDRSGVFYAQSWTLVHYLMTDPKLSAGGAMRHLLALCHGQTPKAEDIAKAIGDTNELDRALAAYVTQNKLPFKRQKSQSPAAAARELQARDLTFREIAPVLGVFLSVMNRPAEARPLLKEALRLDPQQADAREGLGTLALHEHREDEAIQLLGEAVRLPSASAVAHYLYAVLTLGRGSGDEVLGEAQASLERAIALDSGFADALATLARVATNRGAEANQAVGFVRRAIELEPGVFDHRLTMARLLLRCGRIVEARDQAGVLLAGARSEEERSQARSILTSLYEPAASLARDTPALVHILETRCGWERADDCLDLAGRLQHGEGIAADPSRALALYEKVCAAELFEACGLAGWAHESGQGVLQDGARAATLYARGCDGGDLYSCENLSRLLAEGRLVAKDHARSLALAHKACDAGRLAACNTAGVVHLWRKEYGPARSLFSSACDGGKAGACGNLAQLYEQGLGSPRDVPRAVALHKKACDGGVASSCERLKALTGR